MRPVAPEPTVYTWLVDKEQRSAVLIALGVAAVQLALALLASKGAVESWWRVALSFIVTFAVQLGENAGEIPGQFAFARSFFVAVTLACVQVLSVWTNLAADAPFHDLVLGLTFLGHFLYKLGREVRGKDEPQRPADAATSTEGAPRPAFPVADPKAATSSASAADPY